ncbi:thioesterase II family protein [Actinoplanes philippinensis]|uniref:thioesterase II family protein n=1 Tax=Actinoplanes philippinensis TaxID=35752 RepID=UPI0033F837DB
MTGRAVRTPAIVSRFGRGAPRFRLLCLPQAGGTAGSFAAWRSAVPPGVEIATIGLPGRGTRAAEHAPRSVPELADSLVEDLREELTGRYALFGHSFGALVAYELTRRLERAGLPAPRALLVSASRPPHEPPIGRVSQLDDDDGLLRWLERIGGVPPELRRYGRFLRYALDTIRADLALAESYRVAEPAPVHCDLRVFGGAADALAGPEQLESWRPCAAAGFSVTVLPGGHAYPYANPDRTLSALLHAAAPLLPRRDILA